MQQLGMRFGALAVAGSAAALVLAGGPVTAIAQPASGSTTGPEVISGSVHGKPALANAPTIPLKFRGLVSTHGPITLGNSPSKHHTLKTPAGNLSVEQSSKHISQMSNPTTCRFTYTEDITFTVQGATSTGAFAGDSGPGAAQISFSGIEPRYTSGAHKGQCNNNGTPKAKGAVASFLASIVLTTSS
jgi:hypothetical protein